MFSDKEESSYAIRNDWNYCYCHIAENPAALELRRMQMIAEVGVEHNTTTVVLMPSDFVTMAKGITQVLQNKERSE